MAENTEKVVIEETEKSVKTEKTVKAEKATKTKKAKKPSWFKGLKAEFKKIVWPDKKTLAKQTVAVIVCSIALGAVISVVDAVLQYLIDFIVA